MGRLRARPRHALRPGAGARRVRGRDQLSRRVHQDLAFVVDEDVLAGELIDGGARGRRAGAARRARLRRLPRRADPRREEVGRAPRRPSSRRSGRSRTRTRARSGNGSSRRWRSGSVPSSAPKRLAPRRPRLLGRAAAGAAPDLRRAARARGAAWPRRATPCSSPGWSRQPGRLPEAELMRRGLARAGGGAPQRPGRAPHGAERRQRGRARARAGRGRGRRRHLVLAPCARRRALPPAPPGRGGHGRRRATRPARRATTSREVAVFPLVPFQVRRSARRSLGPGGAAGARARPPPAASAVDLRLLGRRAASSTSSASGRPRRGAARWRRCARRRGSASRSSGPDLTTSPLKMSAVRVAGDLDHAARSRCRRRVTTAASRSIAFQETCGSGCRHTARPSSRHTGPCEKGALVSREDAQDAHAAGQALVVEALEGAARHHGRDAVALAVRGAEAERSRARSRGRG